MVWDFQGEALIDIFAAAFAPFTLALFIVAAIGVVEAISLIAGHSATATLDALLVGDISDGIVPDGADVDAGGVLARAFGWLMVGRLPVLVVVVLLFAGFGLTGLIAQWAMISITSVPAPSWSVAIAGVIVAVFATRSVGRRLAAVLPSDETEAVHRAELVGATATILRGTARRGAPAEAKVADAHGKSHYLLVEPDDAAATFSGGDAVRITKLEGAVYFGTLER